MPLTTIPPSRFHWAPLLWFLPAALLLLLIGMWAHFSGWAVGALVAVPLGIGTAIGVIGGRRTTTNKAAYAITSRGARSEAQLRVWAPAEQVSEVMHDVVKDLPRLSLLKISSSEATLKARMNICTWGERITVQFHPAGPNQTNVEARCEPTLGTTVIDYGQGRRDLESLLNAIEEHLQELDSTDRKHL